MSQFHEICTFFFFFDNWQEGWTPLHCAGNILISRKKNSIAIPFNFDFTNFFTAQAGHLDVVKLLTESGAATTAETTNGESYLYLISRVFFYVFLNIFL